MTNTLYASLYAVAIGALVLVAGFATSVHADDVPGIIAGVSNAVPACVTPPHLMQFVRARNRAIGAGEINPRFADIASVYQSLGGCVEVVDGQCVAVRWDYAFFQMLIESNFLLFSGRVKQDSNNFASIGAMSPDKMGERFNSLHDGVLAHLQHVLMYAGVAIKEPIYPRTAIVVSTIRELMGELDHPVSFSDLAKIWTGTHQSTYASEMQAISQHFAHQFCNQ